MKKPVSSTIVVVWILSAITFTGCRSVSPKLQDEYKTTSYTHVKVYEKDGYLYVNGYGRYLSDDGGRLDEHLPGLFFTPSGLCLDLRGPELRWTNYRIKKVDNDTDRNFDIDL